MSPPATLAPPDPQTLPNTSAPSRLPPLDLQGNSRGNSAASAPTSPPATDQRLLSLDTYRGMIMVALAFNGFGLADTAANHLAANPDSTFWQAVKYQFTHVEWEGCAFWDMIQPSFMFMVGVSMAYSYVKRQSRGDSWGSMLAHATIRALVLVLLGVFLSSQGSSVTMTNWAFMNVLSQIGLGYIFLFLMWQRPWPLQLVVVGLLLVGTTLAYDRYPTSGIDLEQGNASVGVTDSWAQEHLTGVPAQWHKNANLGHAIDSTVLNWFPREKPFEFNSGGYQTINFVPSLATMILGLMCGELLRSTWSGWRKVGGLVLAGAGLIALGLVAEHYGWPIIKRLWTPSWALYSTGICCLILGSLYAVIDVIGWRAWSFFFVVVGMNSIAIYMMGQLLRGWTSRQLQVHFGTGIYEFLGATYKPMLTATLVGLAFWLVCWWMMRQKIFIRV